MIGTSLIPRILQSFQDSTVTLLVRGRDDDEVEARVSQIAHGISTEMGIPDLLARLRGIRGDILADGFGIGERARKLLACETTHFIHGAATIRFDHPIDEARRINCGGTERALSFAREGVDQGALERFVYIGTSSVSGRRGGEILEDELEMGQAFFNTYEQSKCESERLVRNASRDIPTTIFRPSIVIGDSRTGRTPSFNVIYIPLRLFDRGLLTFVPGSPQTTLDLVPVDWVADVIVTVTGLEAARGKVCHVTAGRHRAARLGDVITRAGEFFDRHHPLTKPRAVEFITPDEFERRRASRTGREAAFLNQLDTLLPYISVDRLFDSATTDALLEGSGIAFPDFRDYAENIFGYCITTRWGKREG